MSNNAESALLALHSEFFYDVMEATQSLFILLYSMGEVHGSLLPQHSRLTPEARRHQRTVLVPAYLDTHPHVVGLDESDITGRGGQAEQLAYRGWLVQTFGLWEDYYRDKFKAALEAVTGAGDVILPESDVMGEMGYIRNDIVHHRSIATRENMGRCRLFRWFEPGEPIVLGTGHVFTILHHLGLLVCNHVAQRAMEGEDNRIASWWSPDLDSLRSRRPAPRIVSVRTFVEAEPNGQELYLLISVAFENGFSRGFCESLRVAPTEENYATYRELCRQTAVSPEGILSVPALGHSVSSEEVYEHAVNALEADRINAASTTGPQFAGLPGPFMKFRRDVS